MVKLAHNRVSRLILTGWIVYPFERARARARDESYKACFVRHHIVRSPLNVRIHLYRLEIYEIRYS